jgi:DNA polymerase-3 subunit alpha
LLDFCCRVDLRTSNKRVIESLICAGAFDTLPGNRAQKHHELLALMERAAERKKALETGQMGLFAQPMASDFI